LERHSRQENAHSKKVLQKGKATKFRQKKKAIKPAGKSDTENA